MNRQRQRTIDRKNFDKFIDNSGIGVLGEFLHESENFIKEQLSVITNYGFEFFQTQEKVFEKKAKKLLSKYNK